METMSLGESLTFFVVRERDELKYKRVIGVLPRFRTNQTNLNDRMNNSDSYNLGQGKFTPTNVTSVEIS